MFLQEPIGLLDFIKTIQRLILNNMEEQNIVSV